MSGQSLRQDNMVESKSFLISDKKKIDASPRKGMSELSPRRIPRSPRLPDTPPQWKRPNDVMRLHRLKRTSLNSRFSKPTASIQESTVLKGETSIVNQKRKNPFRVNTDSDDNHKKVKPNVSDVSNSHIFHLLGLADPRATYKDPLNVESIIEKIRDQNVPKVKSLDSGHVALPVDWALRQKLRFMAAKPFPWADTLRTCEEASGVTGFVRCTSNKNNIISSSLDSSDSALFHECCLYWQFPHFPWLNLYPRRMAQKKSEIDKHLPPFGSNVEIKTALHSDFTDAFRSVFQLIRARLCPYFYLSSNTFYCLFRAAGVSGNSEISAIVTPSTQGFRQILRNNGIEFGMPLRSQDKARRSLESEKDKPPEDEIDNDDDDDDQGETNEWLASLGLADNDVKNLSSSNFEATNTENELDGNEESTLCIYGSEVCALFNVLINLRSLTSSTGPLAGIPPTIISPVAFSRAVLINLRTRGSIVQVENDNIHSLEITGPIMPHTIQNLCSILKNNIDEFTLTCATDPPTRSFSKAIDLKINERAVADSDGNPAFNIENLSDCGLKKSVISEFCKVVCGSYDSVKYSDQLFSVI